MCHCCCLVAKSCPTLCDPMDCSLPASLTRGCSRQKYWSVLPYPSPADLPKPGIKTTSPVLAGRFFFFVCLFVFCLFCFFFWQVDSLPLSHLGSPHCATPVLSRTPATGYMWLLSNQNMTQSYWDMWSRKCILDVNNLVILKKKSKIFWWFLYLNTEILMFYVLLIFN